MDEIVLDLDEIITQLMEYAGCRKVTEFQSKIKAKTAQSIREILKGKTKTLSFEMESNIKSAFPEVSVVWLRTGNGPMLKADRCSTAVGDAANAQHGDSYTYHNGVDAATIDRLIGEMAEQRKQYSQQIDRLLPLLERRP